MPVTSLERHTTSMEGPALGDPESLPRPLDYPKSVIDRLSAIAMLDGADVPLDVGITATEWPVGAGMLQFPSVTPDGVAVRDASPDYWTRQLLRIKAEGFDWVEIPSAWLPIGEISPAQRGALAEVLKATRLGVCATSVVRQSVIDPR